MNKTQEITGAVTANALKMAIEALDDLELCDYATAHKAINACKEALKSQEQEPVAWIGLTDIERQNIIKELSGYDSDANNNDVALWIEKALKEKNIHPCKGCKHD